MLQEFKKHSIAYSVLTITLATLVILFLAAWPSRVFQRYIALAIVFFYIAWGAATHVKAQHFTKRILYEYIGVAMLGGLMLILTTL